MKRIPRPTKPPEPKKPSSRNPACPFCGRHTLLKIDTINEDEFENEVGTTNRTDIYRCNLCGHEPSFLTTKVWRDENGTPINPKDRQKKSEEQPMTKTENMPKDYSELPKHLEKYVEFPYGGLFGRAPIVQVVEEIIADPHSERTVKGTSKLLNLPKESVKHAFSVLVGLHLMTHKKKDKKNVYVVNLDSHQVIALTFLAYAVGDDIKSSEGKTSNCMDVAIKDYYERYMEKEKV
jgi:hypothetical protein